MPATEEHSKQSRKKKIPVTVKRQRDHYSVSKSFLKFLIRVRDVSWARSSQVEQMADPVWILREPGVRAWVTSHNCK